MKKKKRPFRCSCCGVVFGKGNNIDQQYVAEGLCRSCYRGRCRNPDYQPEITYHHLSQRRFAGLCKECGKPMYYTTNVWDDERRCAKERHTSCYYRWRKRMAKQRALIAAGEMFENGGGI